MAGKYYHYLLTKHALGRDAREYCSNRGLSEDIMKEFLAGYAPPISGESHLTSFLMQEGFNDKELIESGLCVKKGRIVDKFIDRIMFPITDSVGAVIGFSARVYKNSDTRPKYLNSPETIIFQKRLNLYGLYNAKKEIREKNFVIFVEGSTDVISSHKAGIRNIVAPLGTGVTLQQIEKIKKYTSEIAIAFDTDSAGELAQKRLMTLAYQNSFTVTTITIPFGNDADECIRHDPQLWKKAVLARVPSITSRLNVLTQRHNQQTLEGKQDILNDIFPLMRSIADPVTREHHIKELHYLLDIPISSINAGIKTKGGMPTTAGDDAPAPYQHGSLTHEMYLLALLLQFPTLLTWAHEKVPLESFASPQISNIIQKLLEHPVESADKPLQKIVDTLPDDEKTLTQELLMQLLWIEEPSQNELTTEATLAIRNIKKSAIKTEIADLKRKISLAEQRGDIKEANEALNTINAHLKELEALQSQVVTETI